MLVAVQYLHENEVVHRDLKPENLLYEDLTDESNLKVADFGLSKIIDREVTMNTVCGTLATVVSPLATVVSPPATVVSPLWLLW
eukprot:XP_019919473.1 PREDICTED: calcium/calmodulin-dependent protein kinase type IV-like [Crassostrea gigas]